MYGNWELRSGNARYSFGPPGKAVQVAGFTFTGDSYRTDDTAMPRADGTMFGADFIESGEIVIRILIDYTDRPLAAVDRARMAWEARAAFARAWRADAIRSTPGAMSELTIGGEFMVEGRSRRVTWDDSAQNRGLVKGEAHFTPAGNGAFDVGSGWHTQTVGLLPSSMGGITAPLIAPITTAIGSDRGRSFEVGGTEPAWPIVTITGPLMAGAQFELTGGWRMPLNRALGAFDTVVIDTRPGHRAMTLNKKPANVLKDDAVLLTKASIKPGLQEIALRGNSLEGTATASIRWLNQVGGI